MDKALSQPDQLKDTFTLVSTTAATAFLVSNIQLATCAEKRLTTAVCIELGRVQHNGDRCLYRCLSPRLLSCWAGSDGGPHSCCPSWLAVYLRL